MSLVIMNTFKGQDKEVLKELGAKSFCEILNVPHKLTNKFSRWIFLFTNLRSFLFQRNITHEWQMKCQIS